MEHRRLGPSGAKVSAIGLGTNTFGRDVDQEGATGVVDACMEVGINFFDTAELYGGGRSEEFLGRALKGRRHDVAIATKTGFRSDPDDGLGGRLTRRRLISRLEASLRRLDTDYVDVYYFHSPDPVTPLEESSRAMEELVKSGKVLYPACSNFAAWELVALSELGRHRGYWPTVAIQSEYSLLNRKVEEEVIPACDHLGIGLVAYFPLAAGFLTGKYREGGTIPENSRGTSAGWQKTWLTQDNFAALKRFETVANRLEIPMAELAIAWVLAQPTVASVIVGARSPEQVKGNVRALEQRLGSDDLAELA